MQKLTLELLHDILLEAEFLADQIARTNFTAFMQDEVKKRAFVRSLEIIGEAVKKIPPDIRNQFPQIEWKKIAGMRDRLIHNYVDVDYALVWDVANSKVREVSRQLRSFVDANKNKSP